MSAIILNAFLSLGLLSRLKYAIIKFREVNDRISVIARAYRINRRIEKERNRDRSVSGRGLINEKGVTWRCAAHQPRFAPFHLRFHPLLRRSFGLSFCSPSFFSHALLLRHTYVTLTLSTKPFSSLLFLFFFLLFSFCLDRLIFLFQPSLLSRIFTLPRFSAITFRNAASPPILSLPMIPRLQTMPPNTSSTSRSFTFVGLLDKQVGKSGGLLSSSTPRNPRPCICDTTPVFVLRTVSPVDYLRLFHI